MKKFNFGDKRKDEMVEGDFRKMMEMRKGAIPDLEDSINSILDDYHGEMLAIVRVSEDENGDPNSHAIFIGGVAGIESQIRLARSLHEAEKSIHDSLLKNATENPRAALEIADKLLDEIRKSIEGNKPREK